MQEASSNEAAGKHIEQNADREKSYFSDQGDSNDNKQSFNAFSVEEYIGRIFHFVKNINDAFFIVDANSRQILQANSAATRLTGYTTEELLSLKIDNLHTQEELPLLLLEIQRLEFEENTGIEDFTLIQKNGWKFPVDIEFSRLVAEEEEFAHKYLIAVYQSGSETGRKDTISRQNQKLIALTEVGQTIASALDLNEVIDLTMLKLVSVCEAKYASIFLKDRDDQLKMHKAHKNPPEDITLFDRPWRLGIEEGPYHLVNESQKILKIEDVFTNKQFQKWRPIAEKIGYRSLISLAMIPRDKMLGVFNLYYEKPKKFNQEEINFLRAAVTYLSISIENARLDREHKEKADQITAVNEITNSINSSLDLNEVIKTVAFEVKNIVDFDYISIVLFDEDTNNLRAFALASEKLGSRLGSDRWVPIKDSNLGWIKSEDGLIADTRLEDKSHASISEGKLMIENEIKSKLNMLLLSKNKYLGTFSIGKLEAEVYNKTHREIFRQISGQVATALENAKMFEEAKRRLTEFSALADVSKTISSSLNIREVLDLIVKAAATAMHAKICTIWFVGDDKSIGKYSSNGDDVSLVQTSLRDKLDQIIKHMKPVCIENLEQEGVEIPELPEALRATKLRSYLGVPVISRNKTIAVLSVYKEAYHRFDEREIKLLSTVANQAAIAIENARLYERERRRAAQLAMVNEVGKKTTETLNLSDLLNNVTKAIHEIFDYHHVAIYLVAAESNEAVLKSQAGALSEKISVNSRLENPKTPIARSLKSTRTSLIQDLSQETEIEEGYPGKGSLLCIPLYVADRINGTLVLFSKRKNAFDRRDIYAFETLASQIASSLENARLFEETRKNSDKLAQANAELENFVFTVSHDLKSPLVSVQGFSTILLDDFSDNLNSEALHYLERIQSNISQMEKLIKDLLELSRIGRIIDNMELTDINEVVKTVVSDLQFQAQEKDIQIDYSSDFPKLLCNRDRILQVFTNLISNAIKYIGDVSDPKIEVGYQEDALNYKFYVKDNGIGIDPYYHNKIFELFQSLKEIKDVEGTGVGLAIVKRIVENHKGQVWVESQKNKGSTFWFSLPKQK